MKSEKEIQDKIIKLDNESDELVIERNKSKYPDIYLQREITQRMHTMDALVQRGHLELKWVNDVMYYKLKIVVEV